METPRPKLTPAEALARVGKNEYVEFRDCPHCGEPIAIYVTKQLEPQTLSLQVHLDTALRPDSKDPGDRF